GPPAAGRTGSASGAGGVCDRAGAAVGVVPRPLVDVPLPAWRGQIEEAVGAQHHVGAHAIRRVGVEHPAAVAREHADAMLIGVTGDVPGKAFPLQRFGAFVVVLDGRDGLVAADVEVVVEV